RRPGRRERDRARDAMDQTGIADLARRQIGELSGGQRQRVFLARALAQGPELYVMDEPFQGIDAKSQQAIVAVLHRLRDQERTAANINLDPTAMRHIFNHVILLLRRVVSSRSEQEAFAPEHRRVAYDVTAGDDAFLESS